MFELHVLLLRVLPLDDTNQMPLSEFELQLLLLRILLLLDVWRRMPARLFKQVLFLSVLSFDEMRYMPN
jgi:hypothetical protein